MAARTNSQRRYRVAQWATGNVGKVAIRHFAENPVFELSAVLVFGAEKVGKDAGELAGIAPIGVRATDDVDAIVDLDVDCVMYAPIWLDVDAVCRLLSSGKNVVSTSGPFYRNRVHRHRFRSDRGGVPRGSGVLSRRRHPSRLSRATCCRSPSRDIASRIDQLHVYEVVDFGADPSKYLVLMGMGPTRSSFSPIHHCWASRCRTLPRA